MAEVHDISEPLSIPSDHRRFRQRVVRDQVVAQTTRLLRWRASVLREPRRNIDRCEKQPLWSFASAYVPGPIGHKLARLKLLEA
jgi:hypothetical protein